MKILTKQVLDSWNIQIKSAQKLTDQLDDNQLELEIAPNKNTGKYLPGHLIAVSNGMLPLLGFGEKHYPELEIPFVRTPDKNGQDGPDIPTLRQNWKGINQKLSDQFMLLNTSDWLARHTTDTEGAFLKEPHRNKINVVMSRTSHLAYHPGQLAMLRK